MITYYGGKRRLARLIVSLMPPHRVYVEPFAGGLSVLFAKRPAPLEVVNDKDDRIANIYRVLREDAKARELVAKLYLTPYSRTMHARMRTALRKRKEEEISDIDQAWCAIGELGMAINCKFGSGWRSSTGADGERTTVVQPATYHAQLERIIESLPRMAHLEVENRDALEVIQRHDGPETLHYCDPPYPGSDQGHYQGYSQEDFAGLFEVLSACRGSAMLSCYSGAVDEERAKARGWRVERVDVTISSNRHAKDEDGNLYGAERTEEIWIRSTYVPPAQASLF